MNKYNFTTKLHEACAKDELRPLLNCVHFSGGFAYASNAHLLIKQSLEYHSILNPEMLDNKSIHRENYKNILSFDIAECNKEGVECKDKDGRTAFFSYFDREDQEIPAFDEVLQKTSLVQLSFIGIQPKWFKVLSNALHSTDGNIRMRFQGIDRPILIDAIGIEDQEAIIMPVILEDVLF